MLNFIVQKYCKKPPIYWQKMELLTSEKSLVTPKIRDAHGDGV